MSQLQRGATREIMLKQKHIHKDHMIFIIYLAQWCR